MLAGNAFGWAYPAQAYAGAATVTVATGPHATLAVPDEDGALALTTAQFTLSSVTRGRTKAPVG